MNTHYTLASVPSVSAPMICRKVENVSANDPNENLDEDKEEKDDNNDNSEQWEDPDLGQDGVYTDPDGTN